LSTPVQHTTECSVVAVAPVCGKVHSRWGQDHE